MSKKKSIVVAKKMIRKHIKNVSGGFVVTKSMVKYWFNVINKASFGGMLKKVPLHVQRLRGMVGRINVYQSIEGVITSQIFINGYRIRDKAYMINTIAHEMVHLWQVQTFNNLKSVCHNHTYYEWKRYFKTLGITL